MQQLTCKLYCPLQIVHSRTFGTAAKKGGVGVRLLLPLVDMVRVLQAVFSSEQKQLAPARAYAPALTRRTS